MIGRSWAEATVDLLLAAAGLSVVVYPAVSVAYALATGAPMDTDFPAFATAVVAVGGSYPFVAGDWSYGRLGRFVAALFVVVALASVGGLVVLSRAGGPLPDTTVARAAVLAVAYPIATAVAFRDRLPWRRPGPPESAP